MSKGKTMRAIVSLLVLGLLTSCAGSSVGDSVQQSLEADPQLEESPPFAANESDEPPDEGADADQTAAAPASDSRDRSSDLRPPEPIRLRPTDDSGSDRNREVTNVPLTGVPADLQSYLRDLQALNVIDLAQSTPDGEPPTDDREQSPFTQTITRREYAGWLFDSYNTIYADEPSERLRSGSPSDAPAFEDVSPDDPGFAAIQGLAEAGIIPSAFTGNSTDVNFRPEAPLTREDLILWKVPLDIRAALPSTTPETVKTAWGFQDTASIEPLALRAIAADYQLGDFANFRRAFGYTTLFRPDKTVSRAEAAAVLWRFGTQTDGVTAAEVSAD